MAGISLVMGITGILTSFLAIGLIPSFIGLVIGISSKKKKESRAKAGIITSVIGLILSIVFVLIYARMIKNSGGGVSDFIANQGVQEAAAPIINEYNTPPAQMGFPEDDGYSPRRDDSVLLSRKDFDMIIPDPVIEKLPGGMLLYYCSVMTKDALPEYIYSYYDKHFLTADEKHALINTADNTVSEIECMGEYLRVAVHKYTPGSEKSADSIFSGDVLQV